jgi:hypothetical protein
MARTTILVPKKLWFRAARNAAYTKNRLPHSALGGKVPLELLKKTNIEEERKFLRTFGERIYAHIIELKNKLAARSTAARIIGYTSTHGIYKIYDEMGKIRLTKNPRRKEPESDDEDTEIPITNTSKKQLDNRSEPAIGQSQQ